MIDFFLFVCYCSTVFSSFQQQKGGLSLEAKPIVVLIARDTCDSDLGSGHNPRKEALVFSVREDCGCAIWDYDNEWDFADGYGKVKMAISDGSVILLAIECARYGPDPAETYCRVRADFPDLPIVVFPNYMRDDEFRGDKERNIKALDIERPILYLWIRRLVDKYNAKLKAKEVAIQMSLLERAYAVNYLGDSELDMLGVPSHNDQVVAEFLRIRLTPSAQIGNEFDRTIDRTPRKLPQVGRRVYEEEINRIRLMGGVEREEFNYSLDRQSRGFLGVGCGQDASGFAIDPETLEIATTNGFGEHGLAKTWLARRLSHIRAIRNGTSSIEEYYGCGIEAGLASGLIIANVEGFETPILRLWVGDMSDRETRRVVARIISLRQYIPVEVNGELLEG